jgi:hypothetical protein
MGVEIRANAAVKVIVKGGALWVALESGGTARPVVLSAADPKRTFLQFVERQHLPDDFLASIESFKVRAHRPRSTLP